MPSYITIQHAADRLSVSTKTIRRMIARSQLRAYRVGDRLIRIDVESLDALARPVTIAA